MIKFITEKYNKVKKDYLTRSPYGKWLFVRNFGNFFLNVGGCDILDPDFKVSWYSYCHFVLFIDVICGVCYTVWYYTDTPMRGFFMVPTFGVSLPVNK